MRMTFVALVCSAVVPVAASLLVQPAAAQDPRACGGYGPQGWWCYNRPACGGYGPQDPRCYGDYRPRYRSDYYEREREERRERRRREFYEDRRYYWR